MHADAMLARSIERALGVASALAERAPATNLRAELGQLLGAVYALQRARSEGYTDAKGDRTDDLDDAWSELGRVAAELEAGRGYAGGVLWSDFVAGFYFNAAVSRIARLNEIMNVSGGAPSEAMQAVTDRDNYLKHRNRVMGRSVATVANVAAALDELTERFAKA